MAWKIESIDESPVEAPKEESLLGGLARHGLRTAARAEETLLGLPGDILQAGINVADWGSQKLLGTQPANIQSPLPTSEQIREKGRGLWGRQFLPEDYVEPQSRGEERADEFTQDVASLLFPMGEALTVGKAIKAGATAGVGQLASWGAEKLGAGKEGQQAARAGSMLFTSLVGIPSAQKYASGLYDKGKDIIRNIPFELEATPLREGLLKSKEKIAKSGMPFSDKLEKLIDKALLNTTETTGGYVANAEDLLNLKQGINQWVPLADTPLEAKSISDMSKMISHYLKKGADIGLKRGGEYKKEYDMFAKILEEADSIWHAISQQGPISEFLTTQLDKIARSPITKSMFLHYPIKAAGLVGSMAGVKGTINTIDQLIKSPEIRNYYAKAMNAALKENGPLFAKFVAKIDDEIAKGEGSSDAWKVVSLE